MYVYEVTLKWADGKVEKTNSLDAPRIYDNALRLTISRDEQRVIPLTSLREWTWRQI